MAPMLFFYCCASCGTQPLMWHYWAKEHLPAPFKVCSIKLLALIKNTEQHLYPVPVSIDCATCLSDALLKPWMGFRSKCDNRFKHSLTQCVLMQCTADHRRTQAWAAETGRITHHCLSIRQRYLDFLSKLGKHMHVSILLGSIHCFIACLKLTYN